MWLESSRRLSRFCTLYGWPGWNTPSYKDIWKQSVVGFQKVGTSGLVWHAIWCLVSTTFTTYLAMRSIHLTSALQKLHRAPLGHIHIKFEWPACFTEKNSKRVAIGLHLILPDCYWVAFNSSSTLSVAPQYPTLRLFELWFSERLVCSHCLLQHVFLFGIPWMLLCEARFFVSYSCRCLQIVWNFLYTTLIRDRHAWN